MINVCPSRGWPPGRYGTEHVGSSFVSWSCPEPGSLAYLLDAMDESVAPAAATTRPMTTGCVNMVEGSNML